MKKKITIILNLFLGLILSAQTTHWVTNNNDSGTGSLREIIDSAGNGDTVRFNQSLLGQTNQPLFYIYDDGTVEKKVIIK